MEDAWGTHGQRIGNLQFWPVRCRAPNFCLKARSHRGDAWGTHGQRIGNLQFGPVRCRSLGVRHHSLLVRRARWTNAGPALCMRRHSLCASGFFEHAQKCARSSTHEYTHQRHARLTRSALDQRQTYAGHTPCIRSAR